MAQSQISTSLQLARVAKTKALAVFQELVGDAAVGLIRLPQGGYRLKVNLSKAPNKSVVLPREIDGLPVRIEVVGTISKR